MKPSRGDYLAAVIRFTLYYLTMYAVTEDDRRWWDWHQ